MSYLILFLMTILGVSCHSFVRNSGDHAIQYKNIEKHIKTLSSDRFSGRMPTTPAEKLTIDYISSQMKEIGLEPANNGSYFQEVPLLTVTSKISSTLDFVTPKGALQLQNELGRL